MSRLSQRYADALARLKALEKKQEIEIWKMSFSFSGEPTHFCTACNAKVRIIPRSRIDGTKLPPVCASCKAVIKEEAEVKNDERAECGADLKKSTEESQP